MFHSRFGGLWIDRADWRRRIDEKGLSSPLASDVAHFAEHGYVILNGACTHDAIDAFQDEVSHAFREGRAGVLYQRPGDMVNHALDGPTDQAGIRIVDAYGSLPRALDLFASDRLVTFLGTIFEDVPLLHQSLSFHRGSEQGLHQDTAYVVIDRPLELAACWIALEDVLEGAGELIFVPGSHRDPEFLFDPSRKHFNPIEDGPDRHAQWAMVLRERAAQRGVRRFLAKKGDVLVWHADLVHGGAPVIERELSRQSLVGHFCPLSARPHYFYVGSLRNAINHHGRLAFSSDRYDVDSQST